jgi:hypothetical protein
VWGSDIRGDDDAVLVGFRLNGEAVSDVNPGIGENDVGMVLDCEKAAFGTIVNVSTSFDKNVDGITFEMGFDIIGSVPPRELHTVGVGDLKFDATGNFSVSADSDSQGHVQHAASLLTRGRGGQQIPNVLATFPKSLDGESVMPLGQPLARFIHNERVVEVTGLGELKQILKNPVNMGGAKKIFASRDMADFLGSVIDDDSEMVGSADILAGQNDVTEKFRVDCDYSVALIRKSERSGHGGCFCGIEPPGWFALRRS